MKNYFFIAILFFYSNSYSQSNNWDIIQNDFILLKDSIDNNSILKSLKNKIILEISENNFVSDDNLISVLNSIQYDSIFYDPNSNFFYPEIYEIPPTIQSYFRSLKFENISEKIELLDSLFLSDEILISDLMNYKTEYDSTYLRTRFYSNFDNSTKYKIINYYYRVINSNNQPPISEFIINSRNDLFLHSRILQYYSYQSSFDTTILNQEKDWFISNYDMTDSLNIAYFEYQICLKPTPDLLLFNEKLDKSLDSSHAAILIKEQQYFDSLALAPEIIDTSTAELALNWKISNDTTLHYPHQKNYYAGDDGTRFDIFETDELINKAAGLIINGFYDTIHTEIQLNFSIKSIYLRKILQIIGDRYVFGIFTPNNDQRQKLDQITEIYSSFLVNNSNHVMRDEAEFQLLRLWNINYDTYVNWIKNFEYFTSKQTFACNYLHYFLDEPKILSLLSIIKEQEDLGHHDVIKRLLKPLGDIYFIKDMSDLFRPPKKSDKITKKFL